MLIANTEAGPTIAVYVISDYPVVRAGLRAILEGSRDCSLAGEGRIEELLPLAGSARPDVVLMELPRSTAEVTEGLWRIAAEMPETAVVVLSGDASEATARDVLEAGARGYLLRDVSSEEILQAIRTVHQGLTVLHPATIRVLLARSTPSPPVAAGELLSARELEVLQLLAQGLPSKNIAARLQISEHTVKFHVGSILGKLGAASRTEAVALAARRGLIAL